MTQTTLQKDELNQLNYKRNELLHLIGRFREDYKKSRSKVRELKHELRQINLKIKTLETTKNE